MYLRTAGQTAVGEGQKKSPFGEVPSPADADVGGLSPSGRGEDLGPREQLEMAVP
jgi:hypothetical protein